jgi:hypothetical protein
LWASGTLQVIGVAVDASWRDAADEQRRLLVGIYRPRLHSLLAFIPTPITGFFITLVVSMRSDQFVEGTAASDPRKLGHKAGVQGLRVFIIKQGAGIW